MKRSPLNARQVLLVLVVVLVVSSFLPARWAGGLSAPPRHIINAAARPVTYPLKLLADSIRRPPDLRVDNSSNEALARQYEAALQTIRRLEMQLEDAQQEIATLSQVRTNLGLSGVQLYPASVTAWSTGRAQPSLTINRGSRHRVRVGMVVASGFNLVGRVSSVGQVTSTVRLITAPDTRVTVRIVPPLPDSPSRQMLVQAQTVAGEDRLMAQTDVDDPARVGDLAHLDDERWPAAANGLVVGKVVAIENDPEDPLLRRHTYIQPLRSLAYLDRVVVLLPAQGATSPDHQPVITHELPGTEP